MTTPPTNPLAARGLRGIVGTDATGLERAAKNNPKQGTTLRMGGVLAPDDYATTDVDGKPITVTRVRPGGAPVALTGDWAADPGAVIAQGIAVLAQLGIVNTDGVAGL